MSSECDKFGYLTGIWHLFTILWIKEKLYVEGKKNLIQWLKGFMLFSEWILEVQF